MLNQTATQEGKMAKHYKQGYNSRLDESLGMRRGKESSKKQSYKSRRDESRGMRKHNADMHSKADKETQLYHKGKDYYGPGYGEPSNLPQREIMHKYPEPYPSLKTDYHDTITGIDDDLMDSFRKVERHPSDSMY
jgi:hypothetical protein